MFKETTIEVYDRVLQELTGQEQLSDVVMSFDVTKVVAFRESMGDDGEKTNKSVIYLVSGESFIIDIPYNELKKLF